MKKKILAVVAGSIGLFILSGRMSAYHSDSVFDQEKLATITGTVTKFVFANPHSRIHMNVEDGKSSTEQWIVRVSGDLQNRSWAHFEE